jgi:hypothetical protein
LLVFSGSGLVRVIVSLIASLAVSFVVSESGLVCAYQLSFFVGLAVLHVSSGSGIVCAISSLIASLAVSSVFLGRRPRVRLSAFRKYPIRTRSGRRFSPLRRQLWSKFCLVKGVLFLARRRLHDQRL